jgi:hypothetical protein
MVIHNLQGFLGLALFENFSELVLAERVKHPPKLAVRYGLRLTHPTHTTYTNFFVVFSRLFQQALNITQNKRTTTSSPFVFN